MSRINISKDNRMSKSSHIQDYPAQSLNSPSIMHYVHCYVVKMVAGGLLAVVILLGVSVKVIGVTQSCPLRVVNTRLEYGAKLSLFWAN